MTHEPYKKNIGRWMDIYIYIHVTVALLLSPYIYIKTVFAFVYIQNKPIEKACADMDDVCVPEFQILSGFL